MFSLLETSPGGVFQALSGLTPNAQYVASGWINNTGNDPGALYLDDSIGDNSQSAPAPNTGGAWQFVSLPYVCQTNGKISVHGWLGNLSGGNAWWDDFALVPAITVGNFGLESGALSPWASWNNSPASVSTAVAHSGKYSLALTGTTGGGVIQDITGLTPGQVYVASGWVQTTGTALGELYLDDTTNNNSTIIAMPNVQNTWQYLSFPFTATSTGTIAIHLWRGNTGTGTVYWDDVSLVTSISAAK